MKKLLPLFLLSAFLFLPQPAYAGLSEGCFPIVECDPGDDYYGNSCQLHIEILSDCGVPSVGKFNAFSCNAGCYEKSVSVPNPPPTCPGGIDFSGNCLIKLDVLDDDVDVDSNGNAAFKLWDGANLTEIIHVDTNGCSDDQIAVSDASELTGWKCEDKPASLRDVVDGLIDFADTLMTELGVVIGIRTPILDALTDLADGNPANLAAALAAFAIPPAPPVPSDNYFGVYVGSTAPTNYDGNLNGNPGGYNFISGKCDEVVADSHVCTAAEIINTYNYDPAALAALTGPMWINSGPPAYTTAAPNDCNGWGTNTNDFFATSWNFDIDFGTASSCNLTQPFACCK